MGKSKRVLGICDVPMWESIEHRRLELQKCLECGTVRYPPSPVCPSCLSLRQEWRPVSGHGRILSWVVFHRKYFDDHQPPYNAIAVRLAEGPIVITNLIGLKPEGSWIGADVEIDYVEHDGKVRHAACLVPR